MVELEFVEFAREGEEGENGTGLVMGIERGPISNFVFTLFGFAPPEKSFAFSISPSFS